MKRDTIVCTCSDFIKPVLKSIQCDTVTIVKQEIFEAAREKDIYVRYFDKPRINNYLRITIGTDEEMEKFLKFLTSYLKIQK